MHRILVDVGAALGASVIVTAGVLTAGTGMTAAPAPPPIHVTRQAGCLDAPVFGLEGSGVTGRASLCIVDEGVRPAARVEGLTAGTTYATWLAYFDRPQQCRQVRCAMADLQGEPAAGVAGRMDAIVADGLRKAHFQGDFRDLRLAGGSEVSLLVFDRGPVTVGDGRSRAQQVLMPTLPGVNVPTGGMPAPGERLVAQAVFDLPGP